MRIKLLLANADGAMPRLEQLPACRETQVRLHMQYWN